MTATGRDGTGHEPLLLRAPGFGAEHGFATRRGGISGGPYAGLNLSAATGDDPAAVARNRELVVGAFGDGATPFLLEQVHGAEVVVARPGDPPPRADAVISDDPRALLAISTADCYPLLYFDPASGAVGAAHCGWRGTVLGLAARVVERLAEAYGAAPASVRVAVGPGICAECYQVGPEVASGFRAAGFPESVARPDAEGRYRLDLVAANLHALERAGVARANVHLTGRCTSCDAELFYSHRRDRGVTGRHWSLVRPAAARRSAAR